jgi:hypothetical protein
MTLTRVGGKGDGGVDLRGWWLLPQESTESSGKVLRRSTPSPYTGERMNVSTPKPARHLRLLAQCKAEKIKAGPRLIREMEGVARRGFDLLHQHAQPKAFGKDSTLAPMPEEWLEEPSASTAISDTITTVVCTRAGFSSSATVEAMRSRVPMLLLHVPFETEDAVRLMEWQQKGPEVDTGDLDSTYPLPTILRAAYANPALTGSAGVLGGALELRKEFMTSEGNDQNEVFSMGLWWR